MAQLCTNQTCYGYTWLARSLDDRLSRQILHATPHPQSEEVLKLPREESDIYGSGLYTTGQYSPSGLNFAHSEFGEVEINFQRLPGLDFAWRARGVGDLPALVRPSPAPDSHPTRMFPPHLTLNFESWCLTPSSLPAPLQSASLAPWLSSPPPPPIPVSHQGLLTLLPFNF